MFTRKKKLAEAISMIKPTSKAALKQQCLYLTNLNVSKAEEMYNFLIKDMGEAIPAVDPATRSFIENFGEQANGIFSWLRENQDMLGQGADFIRSIIAGRRGKVSPEPLPPINE